MADLPNDQTTDANLAVGSPASSALETTSDRDWIRFVGDIGTAYWFHLAFDAGVDGSSEGMRIYTNDGVATQITGYGAGDAVMVFTPADDLPAFIEVTNNNSFTASADKTYTLTAHVVDDTAAKTHTNRTIGRDDAIIDLFEAPGDRDWVAMQVTAGESYEILFEAFNQAREKTNLTLRDASGSVLTQVSQGMHDIGQLYQATSTGTVYLDLGRNAAAEDPGSFGYRLSVSDPNDIIPDNSTTTALLPANTATEFRIDHGGDRDWLRMTLDAGQYYRTSITGETTSVGIDAVLRDASGTVVTTVPAFGFGGSTSGTFYLDVGLTDGSASDVTATLIETDDVPGTPATLETLLPGGAYTGDLPDGPDTDFIAIDVVAGSDYLIDVSVLRSHTGKTFSIMRGDDALLSVSPDTQRTGFLSHSADRDERLFVSIDSDFTSSTDQYTITLEQVATDAIAGSSLTTGTVALGQTVSGTVDYGADRDWYRFSADAGVIYEVTMSGISAANVGVHELDGSQVAPHFGRVANSVTNYFAVDTDRDVFIDAGRSAKVERSGDYRLNIEVSPDTVLGSIETFTAIESGKTVSGRIDFSGDFDFYRFETEAGRRYAFVVEDLGEIINPGLQIYFEESGRFVPSVFATDALAVMIYDAEATESIYLAPRITHGSLNLDDVVSDFNLTVVDITDTASGSPESAIALDTGVTLQDTIEVGSDEDWFQLNLVEGQDYVAVLNGQDIVGGEFSIRQGDGTVIAERLVDKTDVTSLTFTGGDNLFLVVDGLGLLDASQYSLVVNPETSGAFEDLTAPLYTGLASGTMVAGSVDTDGLRTITYKFAGLSDVFNRFEGNSFRADRDWSSYEEIQIASAIRVYEDTLNVRFEEVTGFDDADVTFFAAEVSGRFSRGAFSSDTELGFAFLPEGSEFDGNIVFNVEGIGWDSNAGSGDRYDGGLEQFGYGFQTVLHEAGHALGLEHPFERSDISTLFPGLIDADNDGEADDLFGDSGNFGLNQSAYTVMSYVDGWTEHPLGTGDIFLGEQFFGLTASPGGHIGTPMALDIAALQSIYGENRVIAAGDDSYILPDNQTPTAGYSLIWDTGGSDTISYSGARDVALDLRAATLGVEGGGGGFISHVNEARPDDPVIGGFAIAHGVVIEIAQSGAGNDALTGNSASNTLTAGAGNDTLTGGAGDDLLTGGTGEDLFVLTDEHGNDIATDFNLADDQIDATALELTLRQLDILDEADGARLSWATPNATGSLLLRNVSAFDLDASHILISSTANDDTIDGTVAADNIQGTTRAETILALGGEDRINALGGDDLVYGGEGADSIGGADGADRLFGGSRDDVIRGGNGDDFIDGGTFNDLIFGDAGNDSVLGGQGNDVVLGRSGNDTLDGGDNRDNLQGEDGDDVLYGGADFDTLGGGAGADVLYGGDFPDTMRGGEDSDRMFGDGSNDLMFGDGGDDALFGGLGRDNMLGGLGNDTLEGGDDLDKLAGGAGNDTLRGDAGADRLSGQADDDLMLGGDGRDLLFGGDGNDEMHGDGDRDVLLSRDGDDVLYGGDEIDKLYGEDGADLIYGGADTDFIFGGVGNDTAFGGDARDIVRIGAGDDTVFGGLGDDNLRGEAGADLLFGEDGIDFLLGEAGSDTLDGGEGADRLDGGLDNDTLEGSGGNDSVFGSNGDDVVRGGAGDDLVRGGAGNDTITGGLGDDLIIGEAGADRFEFIDGDGADQMLGFGLDEVIAIATGDPLGVTITNTSGKFWRIEYGLTDSIDIRADTGVDLVEGLNVLISASTPEVPDSFA